MKFPFRIVLALLLSSLPLTSLLAGDNTLESAYTLFTANKMAAAKQQVDAVLKKQPNNPAARFLKGRILGKQGKIKQAISVYKQLSKDHPGLPEPYNNLAAIYASQGEYHQARDALLSAINTHPSYAAAYENLGNIYSKMAIIAYNRALELDKQQKPVKLQLANIDRLVTVSGGPTTKSHAAVSTSNPAIAAATEKTTRKITRTPPKIEAKAEAETNAEHQEAQKIIETLYAWSQAWSSQKPVDYLTFYAPDFRIPGNMSRKAWERQRKQRVKKPRFIKITIESPEVLFIDNAHARLSFYQDYHSDKFRDKIRKTLLLQKINAQWRIIEEIVGG